MDGTLADSRFVDHYLFPFNLLGAPAVVLPAGLDDESLPLAVQLVGARWRDEELLAVARAVDSVVDGLHCPPEAPLIQAQSA